MLLLQIPYLEEWCCLLLQLFFFCSFPSCLFISFAFAVVLALSPIPFPLFQGIGHVSVKNLHILH
jgi:hypothetical protein